MTTHNIVYKFNKTSTAWKKHHDRSTAHQSINHTNYFEHFDCFFFHSNLSTNTMLSWHHQAMCNRKTKTPSDSLSLFVARLFRLLGQLNPTEQNQPAHKPDESTRQQACNRTTTMKASSKLWIIQTVRCCKSWKARVSETKSLVIAHLRWFPSLAAINGPSRWLDELVL